jgi:O-antigen ligase
MIIEPASRMTLPVSLDRKRPLGFTGWVMVAALIHAVAIISVGTIFDYEVTTTALLFTALTIGITILLGTTGSRLPIEMRSPPIGAALIIFLVMSAISTQAADMSQIRYDGSAMWRQLGLAMLPVILFWGGRTWGWHNFDFRALDLGMTLLLGICASSIVLDYAGVLVFESYGSRHFGFLGDTVAWIATLPTVYFIVRGRLTLFALCMLLLLMTQTRATLIIVAVAIALYFLLSPAATLRMIIIRIGALVIGFATAFFAQGMVADLVERFQDTDLLENDRTRTIQFTLDVFWDRPAFGSGYNAHAYFFQPYQAITLPANMTLPVAVSTPLQILADSGVVGFVPFLAAVIMMCWLAFRALRTRAVAENMQAVVGLSAWLIAYLIFNQSAAWLIPMSLLSSLAFLVAGIVVGATTQINARKRIAHTGQ